MFPWSTTLWISAVCFVSLLRGLQGHPDWRLFDDAFQYEDYDYPVDETSQRHTENDVRLPVGADQLKRFMNALIMEAGMHYLYPPKGYSKVKIESQSQQDESRGQPEYADMDENREQRQLSACPETCPKYSPVCGSDGTVYDSECHLLKEHCGRNNVTVGSWELCRGKHFLCPSKCMAINDPVCGEDAKLYPNICVMRKRNCGQFIATKRIKYCYERMQGIKVPEICSEDCEEIYKPICGSDKYIYYNECFLRMRNCGNDVEPVDMSVCAKSVECPERCLPIYDPVCGSDRNLYTNLCTMFKDNCGLEIKRMPKSYCKRKG